MYNSLTTMQAVYFVGFIAMWLIATPMNAKFFGIKPALILAISGSYPSVIFFSLWLNNSFAVAYGLAMLAYIPAFAGGVYFFIQWAANYNPPTKGVTA